MQELRPWLFFRERIERKLNHEFGESRDIKGLGFRQYLPAIQVQLQLHHSGSLG